MDEFIPKEVALSFPFANGNYDYEHADEHFINGCESYREWLEKIPVADVKRVVRGKWHDHYQMDSEYAVATCSACGISSSFTDMWLPLYCPMCGAEMEEDYA